MNQDFTYINTYYGVEAVTGRRVTVSGNPGIIVGVIDAYIAVNFDADKPSRVLPCHPTWEVEYGEMGKPRPMSRSEKRYLEYLDQADAWPDFGTYLRACFGKVKPVDDGSSPYGF